MSTSVFCIGELLIDFFCKDVDVDLVAGKHFEKQAGGAPANVSATVVKLGGRSLFCGKVGRDPFGTFLKNTVLETGVDTSMVVLDDEHPTTLAFVSLKGNGERDFTFNRGADAHLTETDIDKDRLDECGILHFGSATALLSDPFRTAYLATMKWGKRAGRFISFDPNYRKDLWAGNDQNFINHVLMGIQLADFVKVSEEELHIITKKNDVSDGTREMHKMGAKIVAVTLGSKGTLISNGYLQEIISSINITSIDSTGAGDAFVGATLYQLAQQKNIKDSCENFDYLKQIIEFSNRVGALVCTKIGAISAIPTTQEVAKLKL